MSTQRLNRLWRASGGPRERGMGLLWFYLHHHALDAPIVRQADLRLLALARPASCDVGRAPITRRESARKSISSASADVKASSNSGETGAPPHRLSPYSVTASGRRNGTRPFRVMPWTLNSVVSSSDGTTIPNPTWNSPASNRRMRKAPFVGADAPMRSSISQRASVAVAASLQAKLPRSRALLCTGKEKRMPSPSVEPIRYRRRRVVVPWRQERHRTRATHAGSARRARCRSASRRLGRLRAERSFLRPTARAAWRLA